MKRYFNQTWDNNNHSNSQFDNGNSLEKKKNEDPSTTVSSSSWFSTIEKNKPPIHQTFSSTHASSNNLETKMKTIHVDQDHFQNSEKVITREPCSSLEEKEKEKEEHTKKTKEMLNLEWTIHSNLISSPFQTSFFQNKNTSKSKTKFTQLQHPPSLSSSSYTLSKTTTTTTMTSTVTTSAELSSSQKLLPFTLDQEPILKKAKTVHSNSNTFSEYSSSSSSSSLPPVTFSEFYSFLSFRFLHLNEGHIQKLKLKLKLKWNASH
ncbi:hypothetical protein HMI54_012098 [Coelomomyces lativittatus]|nr:hypothetical protein HMI54_012098 [Coelomomyces lativittatus]